MVDRTALAPCTCSTGQSRGAHARWCPRRVSWVDYAPVLADTGTTLERRQARTDTELMQHRTLLVEAQQWIDLVLSQRVPGVPARQAMMKWRHRAADLLRRSRS